MKPPSLPTRILRETKYRVAKYWEGLSLRYTKSCLRKENRRIGLFQAVAPGRRNERRRLWRCARLP